MYSEIWSVCLVCLSVSEYITLQLATKLADSEEFNIQKFINLKAAT